MRFHQGDGRVSIRQRHAEAGEIAADSYRGRRVRLSAQIETDNAGRAVLWMRVDGPNMKVLSADWMEDRPINGTTDWKRYDEVLDVPPDAIGIAFGYNLRGKGTVWATDFRLEPVGKDVPISASPTKPLPNAPVNMDFEQ
ncbi:MAG: hypothetical protein KGJ79_02325 [Alphaproteobacteria bacterium]|nr:hypothetical protein [Alphaproteobacteria bacterium]MDE2109950.1 hypothetical protein [Alphaproteobacteria bacterium]MDE2496103.1 hypothetical protein [Alphaproteobacteria bacterium]